ncbi:transcription factor GAGA isoform X2 [Cephus cinctus]|uniref:Transcription factor GAGA isoform X2 n=1 Tax=Cephus cinctus TaxID=211228 RepID=A0AAJ7FHH7_CEPCN|nr:transcription factor GAGA isoform X2 [Cephus cinctus]
MTRFDLDESTFSPPSHDDNFFYIRYSKQSASQQQQEQQQQQQQEQEGFRSIGQVLVETPHKNVTASNQVTSEQQTVSTFKEIKEIDFSKHPLPCQPFVPAAIAKARETKPTQKNFAGKSIVKSQGTDDGFHGEPALCGKSIVQVANQMMSSKINKTLPESRLQESEEVPKKGSQSLPVTPLASPLSTPDSSPKSRRKGYTNRYFTGAFIPDKEKYHGGWILASLLGQSREIVSSKIEEEDEQAIEAVPPKSLNRKKSISTQNLSYLGSDDKAIKNAVYTNVLQAKPSELREMNFWSPTSM